MWFNDCLTCLRDSYRCQIQENLARSRYLVPFKFVHLFIWLSYTGCLRKTDTIRILCLFGTCGSVLNFFYIGNKKFGTWFQRSKNILKLTLYVGQRRWRCRWYLCPKNHIKEGRFWDSDSKTLIDQLAWGKIVTPSGAL